MKNILLSLLLFLPLTLHAKGGHKVGTLRSTNTRPFTIISPCINHAKPINASHDLINYLLPILHEGDDPFLILSKTEAKDNYTYLQTLWEPQGFYFEYQEKNLAHHYASNREDLSLAEITKIFHDYLNGNDSWKTRYKFHRQYFYPDGHESHFNDLSARSSGWSSKP